MPRTENLQGFLGIHFLFWDSCMNLLGNLPSLFLQLLGSKLFNYIFEVTLTIDTEVARHSGVTFRKRLPDLHANWEVLSFSKLFSRSKQNIALISN